MELATDIEHNGEGIHTPKMTPSERSRQRYLERAAKNLCTRCGKVAPRVGKKTCLPCASKHSKQAVPETQEPQAKPVDHVPTILELICRGRK